MVLLLLACSEAPKPAPEDPVARDDTAPGDTDTAADTSADTSADTDTAQDTDTDTAIDERMQACLAMVDAANALLAALPTDQADAIAFDLLDRTRPRWSNLPVPVLARDGVQVGRMPVEAQAAAWALLDASLSEAGARQARDVVALDDYAAADEVLGSEFYVWALYGAPSSTERWAWQLDGHHLVYDFTVDCPDVTMAPTLLGADPFTVPDGPTAGSRALGAEQDEAFILLESLDAAQAAQAIAGDYDLDGLAAGPGHQGEYPAVRGLPGSAMSLDQQVLFTSLIERWVEDQEEAFVPLRMAQLAAELDDTYFLWIGGAAPDTMHYYRVHGPSVWIEFDCAGDYDHVHAVYRDPVNDYGGDDVLAMHYAREGHAWR